jgi:hypothetical protein
MKSQILDPGGIMRVAFAALAVVAALAGCSEGSYSEQEKKLKLEVARYFAELNADASAAVQAAKSTHADHEISSTALNTSQYEWDAAGSVYENVVCPNGACGAELGMMATASEKLRCPQCNQELSPDKAKPMLEIRSGTSMPIVILVRYVRRGLAYDPNSAVKVSARTENEHLISDLIDPANRGKDRIYAGGYYRVVTSSLCTTAFVFKGGELRQVDPENVRKMMGSSEQVSASGLKLGRWSAIEEPLKPWLGKKPAASAAKEEPKSP